MLIIFVIVMLPFTRNYINSKWHLFFPNQHQPHPLERHRIRNAWAVEGTPPVVRLPAPPSTRLSEPGFRMPSVNPDFEAPPLSSHRITTIYDRIRHTAPVVTRTAVRELSIHRRTAEQLHYPQIPQSFSFSQHRVMPHNERILDPRRLDDVPPEDNSRPSCIRMHVSAEINPTAPVERNPTESLRDSSSSVNVGASTSRAPDYFELEPRRPYQPTYKKKRSIEIIISDASSSKRGESTGSDKTREISADDASDKIPEKSTGNVSDRSSPGMSGSGGSNRSSPQPSEGTPSDRSSSSPEKTTNLENLTPIVHREQPITQERLIGGKKGVKRKEASGSEQHSLEMSEHLSSTATAKRSSRASTAESSFSGTGVQRSPRRVSESASGSVEEKIGTRSSEKPSSSKSASNFLSVPSAKRKKESSSEDEDIVAAQRGKRSPSKKPPHKIPKIEEKDESGSSEENQ